MNIQSKQKQKDFSIWEKAVIFLLNVESSNMEMRFNYIEEWVEI